MAPHTPPGGSERPGKAGTLLDMMLLGMTLLGVTLVDST